MWSLEKLKEKLEAISSHGDNLKTVHDEGVTEAAVLVPIVVRNGIPFVLLTVRSMNLSSYPGQVSFPGGKRDPGDSSLVATALRESMEEIGLSENHLKILGSLLPYVTRSETKIRVTPVIAKVVDYEKFRPKLNPFEVCETFIVPLANFIKREFHKCECFPFKGKEIHVDFFEFSQNGNFHMIWGLTALISTCVASLLFDRMPDFEYQQWLFSSDNNYNFKQMHDSFITKSKL